MHAYSFDAAVVVIKRTMFIIKNICDHEIYLGKKAQKKKIIREKFLFA